MKKIKPAYEVSQEILYTICTAAWKICSEYLTDFSSLKPVYTTKYIAAALQAVNDADALVESRKLIALRKVARLNLINAGAYVRHNWQLLKLYINNAYEGDFTAANLCTAGADLYKKTLFNNWSALRSIIDAGNTFIADNFDELSANENMPPAFQNTFKDAGIACKKMSELFFNANISKQKACAGKVVANNIIFKNTMIMLKDGQRIFAKNATLKKQFIFSELIIVHCGVGSASLRGYVLDENNRPVNGATVCAENKPYTITTTAKGYYKIKRIAEGSYIFIVHCAGYAPAKAEVTFIAGKISTLHIKLVCLLEKAA